MMKLYSGLVVAALLFAAVVACSKENSANEVVGRVPEQLVMPRTQYDTSRPFGDLVKPHFFARSPEGELVDVQGNPDLVMEREGKVKIRLKYEQQNYYLDVLALESELMGEHPVHKIYRLNAMGIPIEDDLEKKLQPSIFTNELFQTLHFEYLSGKETSGVIAEVFPDGTFLVIPYEIPPEWRSKDKLIATPSHFHVNPRALGVKDSSLARKFEKEILALTFDEQRYPSPPLAQKECAVYEESRRNKEYLRILSSVGYEFTAAHVVQDTQDEPPSFGEEFSSMLSEGSGEGIQYFGFEPYWVADRLIDLQVSWIEDCDIAGGIRRYSTRDKTDDDFYITVRRSLEPDKRQRYKILHIDRDGASEVIYAAPGIVLMALPLPSDDNYWLLSTEGWKSPESGSVADPRWQSVYIVNITNPDDYYIVEYPIATYPEAPREGHLYGRSVILSSDQTFLFSILYGFRDEGGGLWVADLSDEKFYTEPSRFVRIVAWDHALSSIVLANETNGPSPFISLFMTGKEVRSDFAMTANLLRIKNAGLDSTLEHQERLLQMVGWNPVPFAWQRFPEGQFYVAVRTHFNYESSLLPRAMGVYFVPVDISGDDPKDQSD